MGSGTDSRSYAYRQATAILSADYASVGSFLDLESRQAQEILILEDVRNRTQKLKSNVIAATFTPREKFVGDKHCLNGPELLFPVHCGVDT